jgi:hypothetical protein
MAKNTVKAVRYRPVLLSTKVRYSPPDIVAVMRQMVSKMSGKWRADT